MTVHPLGDAAVLVRVGPGDLSERLARVRAWDAAIRALRLPGVEDVVPAEGSVLVRVDPRLLDPSALAERLVALSPEPVPAEAGPLVELPVSYDGPDLADVAALTGLTEAEVVAAHRASTWTVGFCGFAPGFGYLIGGDPRLRVPRRDTPRTAVPAGSVGLAGDYCGVYPRSSPGGWQLIGRLVGGPPLWDADRAPAALLAPGTRVRFVARSAAADQVEEPGAAQDPARERSAPERPEPPADPALEVLSPGPLTTIQDLGRPGLAHLGVPRSGVADRGALIAANRLLGNAPHAPALEVTLGGLALRALRETTMCVTGADVEVTVDGVPHPRDAVLTVGEGQVLRLGTARAGIRAVVAVRGGPAVPGVLGSASTDLLSGLGPPPLQAGDRLAVGTAHGPVAARVLARDVPPGPAQVLELAVLPGPDEGVEHVLGEWRVSPDSDRIGVRLQPAGGDPSPGDPRPGDPRPGDPRPGDPRPVAHGTRPSEGLVRGAVQLPPSGLPVVFLADHPTTGGYPVVACLTSEAADALAQGRPGQRVRFSPAR